MNGRKAKQLRREQTEEHIPETNWSMGRNRKMRRQVMQFKDRSFTRPGKQQLTELSDKTIVHRKALHAVQDYSEQRHVPVGTNHQKMLARKKYRIDLAKAVEGAKVAPNAAH